RVVATAGASLVSEEVEDLLGPPCDVVVLALEDGAPHCSGVDSVLLKAPLRIGGDPRIPSFLTRNRPAADLRVYVQSRRRRLRRSHRCASYEAEGLHSRAVWRESRRNLTSRYTPPVR